MMRIGESAAPLSGTEAVDVGFGAGTSGVLGRLRTGGLGVVPSFRDGSSSGCGAEGEDDKSHTFEGGGGMKVGRCGDDESSTNRALFRFVDDNSWELCLFSICRGFFVDTGRSLSKGGNSSSERLVASVWSALVCWLLVRSC